jgi:hypothetical protein
VYFNSTLANPAGNGCMLYYNVASNQIDLLNDNVTGVAAGGPERGHYTAKQSVPSECSG